MGFIRKSWVAVLLLASAAGCSSDSPSGVVGGNGQARVFMATSGASTTTQSSGEFSSQASGMDRVAASAIDSINVTITSVQVLQVGRDSASDNQWVTLNLVSSGTGSTGATGRRVNLLAITSDSIQIAQGTLPAGTYTHVRFNYDTTSTRITLKQPITVGQSLFVAGQSYPLRITGGAQSGIKVPASFVVPSEGTGNVTLVFDASASLGTVVATGSGRLQMSSSFSSRSNK